MNKKIVVGVLAVFVLLAAAAIIVPGFIDWNRHTDQIAAQVEKLTGRKVVIGGPVKLQVVPRPLLEVSDVRIANIPGAGAPEMASLTSLEVKIALAPLLTGKVKVDTVRLVKPVIRLERLADGRVNWDFKTPDAGTAPAQAPAAGQPPAAPTAPEQGGAAAAVAIDDLRIDDGTVIYVDAQRGREETVSGINARIAAVSLNGPIESEGSLTLRGHPVSYVLNIAEFVQGRTVPLTFRLYLGDNASLKIDGSVVNVPEKPRLRAKLTGSGPNLAAAISSVAGPDALPVNVARPFTLMGNVEADADGGRLDGLEIRLDETVVNVAAHVAAGDKLVAGATVTSGWIDLDALLKPAPVSAPTPAKDGGKMLKGTATAPSATPAPPAAAEAFALPKDVQAVLSLKVESLVYGGKPIQGVRLEAELANGEVTISQAAARLPGETEIALFGFLTARDGKPRFEGEVESRAVDLAPTLAWLAPGTNLPAPLLKEFSLKTPVVVDPHYAQVTGINAVVGGSHLTGAVTLALRDRLSFGANLSLDKIDLDPFMASSAPKADKPKSGGKSVQAAGGDAGKAPATAPASDPLAGLKALGAFDANVKMAVGAARLNGQMLKNLALDATLQRGSLTLRKLQLGDLAGLTANVTGNLSGLDAVPSAKDLRITAAAKDLAPVAKALKQDLPLPAEAIGRVTLDAKVNGGLLKPAVDADLGALGGSFGLKGTLPLLSLLGADYRLAASARHPDLAGLLRRLGVAYQPQGRIGGLDLKGDVTGTPQAIRVDDLKGMIGTISTAGILSFIPGGTVPKVTADLSLGTVNLDPFLPAKQTGGLFDAWGAVPVPAFWRGTGGNGLVVRAAVSSRWSKASIDLSVLNTLAAVLNLRSPRVNVQGMSLQNLDLGAVVDGGALRVARLKAAVFGGTLDATASATADGRLAAAGRLAGLDLAKAQPVTGGATSAGRANGSFDLTARGRSEAEIISSLAGNLSFTGKDVDVAALTSGQGGFGLGGLVLALNQFAGALGGPKKGEGLADVDAAFTLANGVATAQKLQAITNVGTAVGAGAIDLAAWTADLKGGIQPSPSILSLVFKTTTQKGVNVPFSVTGRLDAPRITVDTAALGTGGLAIPGVDKLLKKKGVGDVLQGILGGGQPQPQQPDQPQQQPQQQEQPQPATPQDLIRGILRKF